jgi:hypothetical protein
MVTYMTECERVVFEVTIRGVSHVALLNTEDLKPYSRHMDRAP